MSRLRPLVCAAVGVVLFFSLDSADPLHASCTVCSPASKVPNSRWGTLEPRAILEDSTNYQFNFEPGCNEEFYFELSMGGDLLFATTGNSVQMWDVAASAANPPEVGEACRPVLGTWKKTDTDFYIKSIGAVPGSDDAVAVALIGGMGFGIVDARNRQFPKVIYQDEGSFGGNPLSGVVARAARIGGRDYAFLKSLQADLLVYDMTAALGLTTTCRDASQQSIQCPGIYQGKWSSRVGGLEIVDDRALVTQGASGLELWDITQPAAPTLINSIASTSRSGDIWKQNGAYYAAVENDQIVEIYTLPSFTKIIDLQTPGSDLPNNRKTRVTRVTHSSDNGLNYLHVAHGSVVGTGPQREYLFDLKTIPQIAAGTTFNPPDELTPPTVGVDGYWGFYYEGNTTGFRHVSPRGAIVSRGHLYRSAWSILDVHALTGPQPPIAGFTVDPVAAPYYGGGSVELTSTSAGAPTGLTWEWLQGGASALITGGNVAQIQFALPEEPVVSYAQPLTLRLTAANAVGTDTFDMDIPLTDPAPVVGDVLVNGSSINVNAFQCETLQAEAIGVIGRDEVNDPLANSWVLNLNQAPITTNLGNSTTATFQISGSEPAGNQYRFRYEASNGAGTAVDFSPLVTVVALPSTLSIDSLTFDPNITDGIVDFTLTDTAGTQWDWDWGDGTSDTYTIGTEGRMPTHGFPPSSLDQTYTVTATVSNCRAGQTPVSQTIDVLVPAFEPLDITSFRAQVFCSFGLCNASPGVSIPFSLAYTGTPTTFDYDWDGDGAFEDSGNTSPVTAHTYPATQTGSVRPAVRISAGSSLSDTFVHIEELVFSVANPPRLTLTGPSSGTVGSTSTYFASVSNCSPLPTSYTFTATRGSVTSAGSSATVRWSTLH